MGNLSSGASSLLRIMIRPPSRIGDFTGETRKS